MLCRWMQVAVDGWANVDRRLMEVACRRVLYRLVIGYPTMNNVRALTVSLNVFPLLLAALHCVQHTAYLENITMTLLSHIVIGKFSRLAGSAAMEGFWWGRKRARCRGTLITLGPGIVTMPFP